MNPLLGQHAYRLLDAGVAGTCTSHGAQNNLYKIRLLLEHDASNTFGMEELLWNVGFEEAMTPLPSRSATRRTGRRTRKGMHRPGAHGRGARRNGRADRGCRRVGGRLIFATGHPGAMILYYLGLSRWAQEMGGDVLTVETRGRYERGVSLDWAGR